MDFYKIKSNYKELGTRNLGYQVEVSGFRTNKSKYICNMECSWLLSQRPTVCM